MQSFAPNRTQVLQYIRDSVSRSAPKQHLFQIFRSVINTYVTLLILHTERSIILETCQSIQILGSSNRNLHNF